MLSSAHMRVASTLARPRPAVTGLSLMRYDNKSVYALKHTRALAGTRPLSRRCPRRPMTLKVCMLSSKHAHVENTLAGSTHMRVENSLAGPRPTVTVLSLMRYETEGVYALKPCTS
jgi:hypothetical protein